MMPLEAHIDEVMRRTGTATASENASLDRTADAARHMAPRVDRPRELAIAREFYGVIIAEFNA